MECGVSEDDELAIADFPGFSHLSDDVRALLEEADSGDDTRRAALLERAAEVVEVFAALGLLQFVFMPENEDEDDDDRVEIDLLDPDAETEGAVAWFSIDEAGYDADRDAVLMFGSLSEILNAPIVLDIDDEDDDEGGVEIEGPGENGHAPGA